MTRHTPGPAVGVPRARALTGILIAVTVLAGITLIGMLAAAALYLWALAEVTAFLLQVMGGPA